jgi:hypothetical protein
MNMVQFMDSSIGGSRQQAIAVQKNLFQWQEMGYKNVYENKEIFAHFG